MRIAALTAALLTHSSCAIHHYDQTTGLERIWGLGYMKMKTAPSNEGLQTVVHGTDVFGISIGKGKTQTYLTAGWHRLEYIDIFKDDVSISLEKPDSSFINFRVGSEPPIKAGGERLGATLGSEIQDETAEPKKNDGT